MLDAGHNPNAVVYTSLIINFFLKVKVIICLKVQTRRFHPPTWIVFWKPVKLKEVDQYFQKFRSVVSWEATQISFMV